MDTLFVELSNGAKLVLNANLDRFIWLSLIQYRLYEQDDAYQHYRLQPANSPSASMVDRKHLCIRILGYNLFKQHSIACSAFVLYWLPIGPLKTNFSAIWNEHHKTYSFLLPTVERKDDAYMSLHSCQMQTSVTIIVMTETGFGILLFKMIDIDVLVKLMYWERIPQNDDRVLEFELWNPYCW